MKTNHLTVVAVALTIAVSFPAALQAGWGDALKTLKRSVEEGGSGSSSEKATEKKSDAGSLFGLDKLSTRQKAKDKSARDQAQKGRGVAVPAGKGAMPTTAEFAKMSQEDLAKWANPSWREWTKDKKATMEGTSDAEINIKKCEARWLAALTAVDYLTDVEALMLAAERADKMNTHGCDHATLMKVNKELPAKAIGRISDGSSLYLWHESDDASRCVADNHIDTPTGLLERLKELGKTADGVLALPTLSAKLGVISQMSEYENKDELREIVDRSEDLGVAALAAVRVGGKRIDKVLAKYSETYDGLKVAGAHLGGDIFKAMLERKKLFPQESLVSVVCDGEIVVCVGKSAFLRAPESTRKVNWIYVDSDLSYKLPELECEGSGNERIKNLFAKFGAEIDEEDDKKVKEAENGVVYAEHRVFDAKLPSGASLRYCLDRAKVDDDAINEIAGVPLHGAFRERDRFWDYDTDIKVRRNLNRIYRHLEHISSSSANALILSGDVMPGGKK